jgi:hypothetical protein
LRNLLPDKEITIAAPASYWYLKGFPIEKMAPLLDYIIYMTYDLHGQVWNPSRFSMRRVTTSINVEFSSSSTVGFWQSVVTAWLPDWHLFTYGREPYRNNRRFGHGELP